MTVPAFPLPFFLGAPGQTALELTVLDSFAGVVGIVALLSARLLRRRVAPRLRWCAL